MARRYRMTPRRREALRRAQAASARKRRRSRNTRIAGGLAAFAAVGGAAYLGSRKRQKRPGTALVHVPGMGKTHINLDRRRPKPNPTPKVTGPKTIFKVNKKGVVKRTTKGRMIYDSGRRRQYWRVEARTRSRRKRG
jgi:hypothetical protein